MHSLSCQKSLFDLPGDIHYLNCAYMSPMLKSSEVAAINALGTLRDPSKVTSEDFFVVVDEVKKVYASLDQLRGFTHSHHTLCILWNEFHHT